MKKILIFLLAAVSFFGLTGCDLFGGGSDVESITISQEDIPNEINVKDFKLEDILITVIDKDGNETKIPLEKSMLSKEDYEKLLVPGIHRITVTYEKQTTTFSIVLVGDDVSVEYIVVFKDLEGNTLKQETVREGMSASAPSVPEKEGYTFVGWSEDFSCVISDLEIVPVYVENGTVDDELLEMIEYNIKMINVYANGYLNTIPDIKIIANEYIQKLYKAKTMEEIESIVMECIENNFQKLFLENNLSIIDFEAPVDWGNVQLFARLSSGEIITYVMYKVPSELCETNSLYICSINKNTVSFYFAGLSNGKNERTIDIEWDKKAYNYSAKEKNSDGLYIIDNNSGDVVEPDNIDEIRNEIINNIKQYLNNHIILEEFKNLSDETINKLIEAISYDELMEINNNFYISFDELCNDLNNRIEDIKKREIEKLNEYVKDYSDLEEIKEFIEKYENIVNDSYDIFVLTDNLGYLYNHLEKLLNENEDFLNNIRNEVLEELENYTNMYNENQEVQNLYHEYYNLIFNALSVQEVKDLFNQYKVMLDDIINQTGSNFDKEREFYIQKLNEAMDEYAYLDGFMELHNEYYNALLDAKTGLEMESIVNAFYEKLQTLINGDDNFLQSQKEKYIESLKEYVSDYMHYSEVNKFLEEASKQINDASSLDELYNLLDELSMKLDHLLQQYPEYLENYRVYCLQEMKDLFEANTHLVGINELFLEYHSKIQEAKSIIEIDTFMEEYFQKVGELDNNIQNDIEKYRDELIKQMEEIHLNCGYKESYKIYIEYKEKMVLASTEEELNMIFNEYIDRINELNNDTGCNHLNTSIVEMFKSTCKEQGYVVKMCSDCNTTITETLPLGEHEYVDGKCTVCGSEEYSDVLYEYSDFVYDENGKIDFRNKYCFYSNGVVRVEEHDYANGEYIYQYAKEAYWAMDEQGIIRIYGDASLSVVYKIKFMLVDGKLEKFEDNNDFEFVKKEYINNIQIQWNDTLNFYNVSEEQHYRYNEICNNLNNASSYEELEQLSFEFNELLQSIYNSIDSNKEFEQNRIRMLEYIENEWAFLQSNYFIKENQYAIYDKIRFDFENARTLEDLDKFMWEFNNLRDEILNGSSGEEECKHENVMIGIKDATCLEPGEETRHCYDCGNIEVIPIPPLGHTYDENGKCIRCGEKKPEVGEVVYTFKYEGLDEVGKPFMKVEYEFYENGVMLSQMYQAMDGKYQMIQEAYLYWVLRDGFVCMYQFPDFSGYPDMKFIVNDDNTLSMYQCPHKNYVDSEIVAPTCKEEGKHIKVCSECGRATIAVSIPKIDHNFDEAGYCTMCGNYKDDGNSGNTEKDIEIIRQETLQLMEFEWNLINQKYNISEDQHYKYKNIYLNASKALSLEEIDAYNIEFKMLMEEIIMNNGPVEECEHANMKIEVVEATCTSVGFIYKFCPDCGFTEQNMTDLALDHLMNEYGECERCGYSENQYGEVVYVFNEDNPDMMFHYDFYADGVVIGRMYTYDANGKKVLAMEATAYWIINDNVISIYDNADLSGEADEKLIVNADGSVSRKY